MDAALRRGAVGRMRIGMTIAELEASAKPSSLNGPAEEKLSICVGGTPIATADITNGSVSRFCILSRAFRTDIGIGVGATLRDLARFYRLSWVGPGWAYVDSLKMRFEIRDGRVASILVC